MLRRRPRVPPPLRHLNLPPQLPLPLAASRSGPQGSAAAAAGGEEGHSPGSLLVGAVTNMLPDLFAAAVVKVPFLDICNTMLDPTLPLTVLDYEEFGDPNVQLNSWQSTAIHLMITYLLRVRVWEAAKWIAKVRDVTCRSCSRSVILRTNMQSSHFGDGGRFIHCDETAFEYAFLMKALGMDNITVT